MTLTTFIQSMPKVELHVHMEGSIRPETLLTLARRYGVPIPPRTPAEMRNWFKFENFDHFITIFSSIVSSLRSEDDIELLARQFLEDQAAQHILYSEVTYTAYTQYLNAGVSFERQLAALNRARAWAAAELGVTVGLVIDISRNTTPEQGLEVADWVISAHNPVDGVIALGLGGPEVGNPPEKFTAAFERARAAGVPAVPHAGETEGPASMWGALKSLHAVRLGHGVRCLEDPALVDYLRQERIPLEVCPTSNVCLGVAPSFEKHPLPRLMDEGLVVTLNSDDPSMFNTTLTLEYLRAAEAFHLNADQVEGLVFTALQASLLPPEQKQALEKRMRFEFADLRARHL